jgi:disulfide bond formation protein DsbB
VSISQTEGMSLAVAIDTVRSVHDVAAVLALIALGGAVLMVAARLIPSVISVRFLDAIYRVQLPLAALVATTAMAGSLWFSESGNHWQPCRFCWFQRIFMYSSAIILIVAAIRRDRQAKWYVVPLATIGMAVSIWHHVFLEHYIVTESKACASAVSCAAPNYVSFGTLELGADGIIRKGFPMTLAAMALCGFAAILALLLTPQPLEIDDGEPQAS